MAADDDRLARIEAKIDSMATKLEASLVHAAVCDHDRADLRADIVALRTLIAEDLRAVHARIEANSTKIGRLIVAIVGTAGAGGAGGAVAKLMGIL